MNIYENGLQIFAQRYQPERTSQCFTRQGLVLMWAAMLLMTLAFFAPTPLTRMIGFISFAIAGLIYFIAMRNGRVFEYVVFEQNHLGRQTISKFTFVIFFVGLIHLAIYNNPVIFPLVALSVAMSATLLRFIGEKKQGE